MLQLLPDEFSYHLNSESRLFSFCTTPQILGSYEEKSYLCIDRFSERHRRSYHPSPALPKEWPAGEIKGIKAREAWQNATGKEASDITFKRFLETLVQDISV